MSRWSPYPNQPPYWNSPNGGPSPWPYRKDFMPLVWKVFILYFLGWVPGFIGNLVALCIVVFSKYDEQEGRGCLIAMFVVLGCGVPLVLYLFLMMLNLIVLRSLIVPTPTPVPVP